MKPCEAEGNCGESWSGRDYLIAGGALAAGAALGFSLMYLFDPSHGTGRRRLIRSQAAGKLRHAGKKFSGRMEDAVNRATGALHKTTSGLREGCEKDATDDVVRERVHSRLGHLVTTPHQIETDVNRGIVALRGTLPPMDRESLVEELQRIPGVMGVVDLLVPAV